VFLEFIAVGAPNTILPSASTPQKAHVVFEFWTIHCVILNGQKTWLQGRKLCIRQ
jgi:hypothetical protein